MRNLESRPANFTPQAAETALEQVKCPKLTRQIGACSFKNCDFAFNTLGLPEPFKVCEIETDPSNAAARRRKRLLYADPATDF